MGALIGEDRRIPLEAMGSPRELKQFDLALVPMGFVRRTHIWSRQACDDIHQVIGLQRSQWSPEFTINAGSVDPQAHAVMFPAASRAFFSTEDAVASCRVGQLMPGLRDVWWKLDDPESIQLGLEATLVTVVPYLDALSSREAMILWLKGQEVHGQDGVSFCRPSRIRLLPMQKIGLAVLLALQGHAAEASAILGTLVTEKNVSFSRYASDVAQRLGLSPMA